MAAPAPGADPSPAAAGLLPEPGQALFDPVRRRYLDALARRTAPLEGPAKALLQSRLAEAQSAYDGAFAAACDQTRVVLKDLETRFPAASPALRRHWAAGDFDAMRRLGDALATQAQHGLLAGLVRHIDPPTEGSGEGAAPAELRAVRQARSTWTRLRVDRQMAESLATLPDNPGPLNSHRLVLRCLQRLQAKAPHYLTHLLSQLDTLAWLEQAMAPPPRAGRPKR